MFQVKAIIPKKVALDPKDYEKAIQAAFTETSYQIIGKMQTTTQTWRSRPTFYRGSFQRKARYYSMRVGTDNAIWGTIDKGTPTRYIVARRKPYLKFRVPYGAKTGVGLLRSKAGFVGDNWVSKRRVRHRIKARGFSKLIAKQEQAYLSRAVQRQFEAVIRRAR